MAGYQAVNGSSPVSLRDSMPSPLSNALRPESTQISHEFEILEKDICSMIELSKILHDRLSGHVLRDPQPSAVDAPKAIDALVGIADRIRSNRLRLSEVCSLLGDIIQRLEV